MNVVDSSGWIEFFLAGPNGPLFKPVVEQRNILLVPVIALFEVHKVLSRKVPLEAVEACLNVMRLGSPNSAILSAVIFNALIIVVLIPLALKGVKYRPVGAAALLRRNLAVYGLGGLVVPFIGIKAIDLLLVALNLV